MSSINRWNPVRDLISLREAMDQVFNDTFFHDHEYRATRPWHLPVDAYATEDTIVLTTDVPGLKAEDVQVTLEGETLTIRGEFKNQVEGRNYLLRERVSGAFERNMTINTPIDRNKVEAAFENGVLTLTLPKAEAVKPKQITVKAVKKQK